MSDSTNIQAIYNAIFDVANGMQSRLERVEAKVDALEADLGVLTVVEYGQAVKLDQVKTEVHAIKVKVGA